MCVCVWGGGGGGREGGLGGGGGGAVTINSIRGQAKRGISLETIKIQITKAPPRRIDR